MADKDNDSKTIPVTDECKDPSPAECEVEELTLTDEELRSLCRERVCPGCDEFERASEDRLRSMAELENFKKRMQREMDEFRKYAAEKVLADLLPVLDNLDLALTHGEKLEGCKDFMVGVDMTRKVFLDTLSQHGLTPVGEKGEPFTPELHEALGQEACEGIGEGCVATLVQRGYKLGERLLRPAKVMVSKG